MDPIAIEPMGDRAYLAHFDDESAAAGWCGAVRDRRWPGVTDVVLAYRSVAVFADPDRVDVADLETRLRAVVVDPARPAVGEEAARDPGPLRRGRSGRRRLGAGPERPRP